MKTIEQIKKEITELKRQQALCVDSCSWCRAYRINRKVKKLEHVLNEIKYIKQ